MAAGLPQTRLSGVNPVYEGLYRQVDPSGSGRVAATDAALLLKRSGLTDIVLGRIWDLADAERKGFLNKRQFFVALHLVACAQNGLGVTPMSLEERVPPPKFCDTNSALLLSGAVTGDSPWVVKSEEKARFDAIFDSLSPVNGLLSGEKVKPVLLNSRLPVDVLGRVWELSDIDRDGMLDRDEFAVAMYLVYRALEKEPVPVPLPAQLVPPSKRQKPVVPSAVPSAMPFAVPSAMPFAVTSAMPSAVPSAVPSAMPSAMPSAVPLLPSPPSAKDRRSSLAGSTPMLKKAAVTQWVVSPADKALYDDTFTKMDVDMDGLVSGPEVRGVFLRTGLPSATLAHIWQLCDISGTGKLTRDQFALALHLINQTLTKGIAPPHALTAEMVPPPDRQNAVNTQAGDFSAIKDLDGLSNEIIELKSEKTSVEQEIREKEENISQRSCEVQGLQDGVQQEGAELQRLQSQRLEVQVQLEQLDLQKSALEEQLGRIQQQCTQENELILSLQAELTEQGQVLGMYEVELGRAQAALRRLREETADMENRVGAARAQLCPLRVSISDTYADVSQMQQKLDGLLAESNDSSLQQGAPAVVNSAAEGQDQEEPWQEERSEGEVERPQTPERPGPSTTATEDVYANPSLIDWPQDSSESSSSGSLAEITSVKEESVESLEGRPFAEVGPSEQEEGADSVQTSPPQKAVPTITELDFFHSDPFTDGDPFKDYPFGKADGSDLFGGDPFKGTDPFSAESFFKQPSADPFASADPFGDLADPAEPDLFNSQTDGAEPVQSGFMPSSVAVREAFAPKLNQAVDPDPFSPRAGVPADPDPFGSSAPAPDLPTPVNDPFAPGGTAVIACSDSDPFAAVFGSLSFGDGFADFSVLSQSNSAVALGSSSTQNNLDLFTEDSQHGNVGAFSAQPPKTATPTRPSPPLPGKLPDVSRPESRNWLEGNGHPLPEGSEDHSTPPSAQQTPEDPDSFAGFDKLLQSKQCPTEGNQEKDQQSPLPPREPEDLELSIALRQSELA